MRVMTLNLMERSPAESRTSRLAKVARFVRDQNVEVLLLQEGCGGLWELTRDSIRDLARQLGYHHFSRNIFGILLFLYYKVGIVSKWPFIWTDAARLYCRTTAWPDRVWLPSKRDVVGAAINHPVHKRVYLYSAHLGAGCDCAGRYDQAVQLLRFIFYGMPGDAKIFLGGDFNAGPDSAALGLVKRSTLIELPTGPTFGLADNPQAAGSPAPAKIDYLFTRGLAGWAQVVLNGGYGPWVSDHAGIMAEIDSGRGS